MEFFLEPNKPLTPKKLSEGTSIPCFTSSIGTKMIFMTLKVGMKIFQLNMNNVILKFKDFDGVCFLVTTTKMTIHPISGKLIFTCIRFYMNRFVFLDESAGLYAWTEPMTYRVYYKLKNYSYYLLVT